MIKEIGEVCDLAKSSSSETIESDFDLGTKPTNNFKSESLPSKKCKK